MLFLNSSLTRFGLLLYVAYISFKPRRVFTIFVVFGIQLDKNDFILRLYCDEYDSNLLAIAKRRDVETHFDNFGVFILEKYRRSTSTEKRVAIYLNINLIYVII